MNTLILLVEGCSARYLLTAVIIHCVLIFILCLPGLLRIMLSTL